MSAGALLTIAWATAQAAPVTYNFVGTGAAFDGHPNEPVAFHLTVPDFVDPTGGEFVFFSCAQVDSSTNCDFSLSAAIGFSDFPSGGFSALLEFNAVNGVAYFFIFPTGAFGSPGFYTTPGVIVNQGGIGELAIAAVPEPTTLLLVLGAVCLGGLQQIRRARRTGSLGHSPASWLGVRDR